MATSEEFLLISKKAPAFGLKELRLYKTHDFIIGLKPERKRVDDLLAISKEEEGEIDVQRTELQELVDQTYALMSWWMSCC